MVHKRPARACYCLVLVSLVGLAVLLSPAMSYGEERVDGDYVENVEVKDEEDELGNSGRREPKRTLGFMAAFGMGQALGVYGGFLSMYDIGSYIAGGGFAFATVVLTSVAIHSSVTKPDLLPRALLMGIPMIVGLSGLSYYNFRYGREHGSVTTFAVNYGVANAVFLWPISVAWTTFWPTSTDEVARNYERSEIWEQVHLGISPTGVNLRIDY